jgi:hypothetical protein
MMVMVVMVAQGVSWWEILDLKNQNKKKVDINTNRSNKQINKYSK